MHLLLVLYHGAAGGDLLLFDGAQLRNMFRTSLLPINITYLTICYNIVYTNIAGNICKCISYIQYVINVCYSLCK